MDMPYRATADVHVLPTTLAIPGVGNIVVNAYLILGEQPVLVDTGLATDGSQFLEALRSVIDPGELRWLWLTHDDADHTGNIEAVMALAPQARLVTHGIGALRMSTWWPVPLERVHAIRPGDRLDVGDRQLRALRPPVFDNPMSAGLIDERTGALFTVDAFGAILPTMPQHAADVAAGDLVAGMRTWATFDAPWAHLVDHERFDPVVEQVTRLSPTTIFSSHLPAASGTSTAQFVKLLQSVPDADPFVPPDEEAFGAIVAGLEQPSPKALAAVLDS
jgi:hypothetical protein